MIGREFFKANIQRNCMRVVLGSKNPVKIKATRQAFSSYFDQVEVIPVAVVSAVKPFPTSRTETLEGAINRSKAAQIAESNAEFAVGIEAGIISVENHFFIQAFSAVINNGQLGLGGSAMFEVPLAVLSKIDPAKESSKQVIDSTLGRTNLLQREGMVGVLTQGRLSRTDILRNAVICTLPPFLVPQYFQSKSR